MNKKVGDKYLKILIKQKSSQIVYDEMFKKNDPMNQTMCCICMEPF